MSLAYTLLILKTKMNLLIKEIASRKSYRQRLLVQETLPHYLTEVQYLCELLQGRNVEAMLVCTQSFSSMMFKIEYCYNGLVALYTKASIILLSRFLHKKIKATFIEPLSQK